VIETAEFAERAPTLPSPASGGGEGCTFRLVENYSAAGTSSRIGRASFFTAFDATIVRLPA
jgi:hypothetical protein